MQAEEGPQRKKLRTDDPAGPQQPQAPPIASLPDDVRERLFSFLPVQSAVALAVTSRGFNRCLKDSYFQALAVSHFPHCLALRALQRPTPSFKQLYSQQMRARSRSKGRRSYRSPHTLADYAFSMEIFERNMAESEEVKDSGPVPAGFSRVFSWAGAATAPAQYPYFPLLTFDHPDLQSFAKTIDNPTDFFEDCKVRFYATDRITGRTALVLYAEEIEWAGYSPLPSRTEHIFQGWSSESDLELGLSFLDHSQMSLYDISFSCDTTLEMELVATADGFALAEVKIATDYPEDIDDDKKMTHDDFLFLLDRALNTVE